MSDKAATETWRDIPEYEGFYKVSDRGKVMSIERKCIARFGERRVRQREMKLTKHKRNGRVESVTVKLSNGGVHKHFTAAHLVLVAFVGPCPDNGVAHYKDGDPTNNHIGNLEWSSFSDIAKIAPKGGYSPPRYSKHWRGDREVKEALSGSPPNPPIPEGKI